MRAARRAATLLAAVALLLGAFTTQAAAIGIDIAGVVIETPAI